LIAKLKGVIDEVQTSSLFIDVKGVVYEVFTPLPFLETINKNENINIFISEIIREDSYTLYGFKEFKEKKLFEELLKINGIGAKVGIAFLSTISFSELANILEKEDEKPLLKIPKVGLKSAKKILIELISIKDKLDLKSLDNNQENSNHEKNIAIEALEQLGFSRKDIIKGLNYCNGKTHQEIIKELLLILKS
jgi:Holliday junction DNA helicase RuvA